MTSLGPAPSTFFWTSIGILSVGSRSLNLLDLTVESVIEQEVCYGNHSSEISVLPAPDGPTTPPVIIGAELRQILDRFWIDIGTDEELDDGPDRLPPVTAFTVTMRARKCGNPVS